MKAASTVGLFLSLAACSLHRTNVASAAATSRAASFRAVAAAGGAEEDEGAVVEATSSASSPATWSTALLERSAKNQDPYVAASPLSAAAVCRDGIALVSLHHIDPVDRPDGEGASSGGNGDDDDAGPIERNNAQHRSLSRIFVDLPPSTRGPLRIEPVHENGCHVSPHSPPPMALLTAGWRTDGMALADAARELMAEEVGLYCLPALASSSVEGRDPSRFIEDGAGVDGEDGRLLENRQSDATTIVGQRGDRQTNALTQQQQPYYGRRIAEGLSYYLAKCSFSEGVRSLSCVGLLASGGRGGGSLYLVDATGTHRVRAHAIGKGSTALHRRMSFVDFSTMDCREGLRALLHLIAEVGGVSPTNSAVSSSDEERLEGAEKKLLGNTGAVSNEVMAKPSFVAKERTPQSNIDDQSLAAQPGQKWNVPMNTVVELVALKSSEGRMRRVRLSSLFTDAD